MHSYLAAFGACCVVAAPATTENPPYQSPESFAAAIRDDSTSPVYVLITVVDDNTGKARTGCTLGNFLLGAIHMQYGLAYDLEVARQTFSEAVKDARACALIEHGLRVRMADLTGALVLDR
jgi:hypothetical protein